MNESALNRRPVVIIFSILAGLQVLTAGAAFTDVIDKDIAALFTLVVAAIQTAATFYVQSMVTPWSSVVSKLEPSGQIIAGPASDGREGPPPAPPVRPLGDPPSSL